MERAFRIFDCDGNGTVSMAEFIDTMHKFAGQSSDEKLVFLFRVYDLDGKYQTLGGFLIFKHLKVIVNRRLDLVRPCLDRLLRRLRFR